MILSVYFTRSGHPAKNRRILHLGSVASIACMHPVSQVYLWRPSPIRTSELDKAEEQEGGTLAQYHIFIYLTYKKDNR